MGALLEMRMLTQKSETHCSGLEYGALLVQLLVFFCCILLDTFIIGDHKSVSEHVQ